VTIAAGGDQIGILCFGDTIHLRRCAWRAIIGLPGTVSRQTADDIPPRPSPSDSSRPISAVVTAVNVLIRRRALGVRCYEVKDKRFGIKPVFPAERRERRRVGHDVIARLGAAAPACSFFQEPSLRTLISVKS
jgi:hypothetical protein